MAFEALNPHLCIPALRAPAVSVRFSSPRVRTGNFFGHNNGDVDNMVRHICSVHQQSPMAKAQAERPILKPLGVGPRTFRSYSFRPAFTTGPWVIWKAYPGILT
ncbi:predicted protein [Chaetomium globosum CBS 148.51]|uniref:Uncharacterized protein n=1 Tax=Chaetomium globosum (strain ATCC 6205 / CBS 148.51 / DSM 1962 / NBRC 6347 / NRRL 1970) TaxID=306901 RepID=Q2HEH7_CHAGB|nr:uncharacterized protein CHGG_01377 [Chaetomium globosum CBS 148.51]EAQ93142.1 predicted protein [Chaetomium globosum CBS 148.51]